MERGHRQKRGGLLDTLLALQEGSVANDAINGLFRALCNVCDDALMITDHQFTILYINHIAAQRFGHYIPELIGNHLSVLFSDRQWPSFENACLAYAAHPGQPAANLSLSVTITPQPHLEWSVMVRSQYLLVEQERIFVFLLRDLEPRSDDQPIARQKRPQHLRLQALGRLTASLAHEYNNLLTSIVGYSEILKMRLNQDAALSRYIEHISDASTRAADLTRHVMAFSRHRSDQPEMCELNAIISDMEKMIRGLFKEDIDLRFEFTPNLGMVWIDLGALLQILIIVILAVREDLTRGSQVMITTQPYRMAPDQTANQSGHMLGEFVNLTIGAKMGPTRVQHDPHQRTPLELAELREDIAGVFHLVRQAGGEIKVVNKSEAEKSFNIYLPVVHRPPAFSETTDKSAQAVRPDMQTILIVDDEDTIRVLIREALRAEGYQVLEASDPLEALELARQYERPIHLLVSDVVMPGMNGQALANQLRVERPDLGILFISGHSMNRLARSGIDNLAGRFLQKPFSTSTLLARVRSALTSPAARSRSAT